MDLKEKIKLHNDGDYDLVAELIELATNSNTFKTTMVATTSTQYGNTYKRWRPKYSPGKTDEERLARNIRIWISRYVRKANSLRNKWSFEGSNSEIADYDVLDHIYLTFTALGYHYYKDDFLSVPQSVWGKIEKVHGWDFADELKSEFDQFCLPLRHINGQKDKLQSEYIPLIEEALIEVLPKVDIERPTSEIIAFVATASKHLVNQKLTKLLNTKVHTVKGERYFVTQERIMKNGFRNSKAENILNVSTSKLTNAQYDFFMKLKTLIEIETNNGNTDPFRFNQEGIPNDINKRYFSEKMNMQESAFKKRLGRIQSK